MTKLIGLAILTASAALCVAAAIHFAPTCKPGDPSFAIAGTWLQAGCR